MLLVEQLPPVGQEVIFKRDSDAVLFYGIRQDNDTYTMSLPDADTTFDPATTSEWYVPE